MDYTVKQSFIYNGVDRAIEVSEMEYTVSTAYETRTYRRQSNAVKKALELGRRGYEITRITRAYGVCDILMRHDTGDRVLNQWDTPGFQCAPDTFGFLYHNGWHLVESE